MSYRLWYFIVEQTKHSYLLCLLGYKCNFDRYFLMPWVKPTKSCRKQWILTTFDYLIARFSCQFYLIWLHHLLLVRDIFVFFSKTDGFTGDRCEQAINVNGTSCPFSDCSTKFDGGQCEVRQLTFFSYNRMFFYYLFLNQFQILIYPLSCLL